MTIGDELSPQGTVAMLWTFTALSIVLTIGRQASRFTTSSRFRVEDVFHGIAQLILISFTACFTVWTRYFDKTQHVTMAGTKPAASPLPVLHLRLALATQFWTIAYFVKFSFLALYRGIFNISRGFMRAWWIVLIFSVLSWLVSVLSVFWICRSPKYLFQPAHCSHKPGAHSSHIIVMSASLNVGTDFLIITLPLSMLRTLQMPRKQKVGLAAVFFLGLVGLAFDILRIWHTVYVAGKGTYAIWDAMEPPIAVIASALPPYKAWLTKSRNKRLSVPKPSQESSPTSGNSSRPSSGVIENTKRPPLDPYSIFDEDDKQNVVTRVRPILNPSPLASGFGEFQEHKIVLNEYKEV